MQNFPIELSAFRHQSTYARPVVESASQTTCLAQARFRPKNLTYDTVIRLRHGEWSVETTMNGRRLSYGEDYALARGYQIGIVVINWWSTTFAPVESSPLPEGIAVQRATWVSRATYKLLTGVGTYAEVIAAVQTLASGYGMDVPLPSTLPRPSLRGATWAAAAHRHLEREVPEPKQMNAVALLVETITGLRPSPGAGPATDVAA